MSYQPPTDPTTGTTPPTNVDYARKYGPAAGIAIVALLFVAQNTDRTHFEFLWFDFNWPMWIILVAFMLIGAAIFYGITVRRRRRKHTVT